MAIFLKLDKIEGPVTQKAFEKQIELNACSVGAQRPIPQQSKNDQNRAVSEVSVSYVEINKDWDGVSSAKLFESITNGVTDMTAEISYTSQTDKGSLTYLTVKLTNVGLASYALGSMGVSGMPTESMALAFTEMEITPYTVGSDKKPVKGGVVKYDLATGVTS